MLVKKFKLVIKRTYYFFNTILKVLLLKASRVVEHTDLFCSCIFSLRPFTPTFETTGCLYILLIYILQASYCCRRQHFAYANSQISPYFCWEQTTLEAHYALVSVTFSKKCGRGYASACSALLLLQDEAMRDTNAQFLFLKFACKFFTNFLFSVAAIVQEYNSVGSLGNTKIPILLKHSLGIRLKAAFNKTSLTDKTAILQAC